MSNIRQVILLELRNDSVSTEVYIPTGYIPTGYIYR